MTKKGDATSAEPPPDDYAERYGERLFRGKLRRFAQAAGRELVERALVLYYCLRDPDTPAWAKRVVAGALGYFVVPLDAIPDLTPVVGFSDDLGAIAAALATVALYVKKEHRARARSALARWFGGDD